MTGGRPLAGITVLSLEQAIAAPLCTRHLADLGARVIKVENPGVGDTARHYDGAVRGLAAHFVWLNHGKESVELNLTDPADAGFSPGCSSEPTCWSATWRRARWAASASPRPSWPPASA